MIFRRNRFADVVARQLDVFAEDEAEGLLEEVRDAKAVYDRADRDESEELYGERYAATLDEPAAVEYEDAFNRAVRKRWPALGLEIDNR